MERTKDTLTPTKMVDVVLFIWNLVSEHIRYAYSIHYKKDYVASEATDNNNIATSARINSYEIGSA